MSRKAWWTASCVVVVLAVVAGVAIQIVSELRQKAQRSECRAKLKQIGLALQNYHDKYQSFPPAYVMGPDGKRWHSWRVLILPFLNEQELYDRYRFDEPWDGPHNRELQTKRPDAFAALSQKSRLKSVTTYLGVVSRRTMWPAHYSVKVSDVADGTSNTIQLIQDIGSDVIWSEPREMREKDALALLRPQTKGQQTDSIPDTIQTLFADGSVRSLSPKINRDRFVSLLTPRFGEYVVAEGWPREEEDTPRLPDTVDVSQYPRTRILATADSSIIPSETSVYCATVQLAWDQLRPGINQPVVVTDATPTVAALNAHPFPIDDLSKDDYFAGAADLSPTTSGNLFDQLRERFPNAPVEMLQNPNNLTGIRILAYLQKSLPFAGVMERFPQPLSFKHDGDLTDVKSFGWPASSGTDNEALVFQETVEICDYTAPDDFIVLLKSDSTTKDEIILARIRPAATMQATWDAVAARMIKPNAPRVARGLRQMDHLQIPIISFGVTAPLKELIGLGLPTAKSPQRFIADARQTMRFRLDEYGAELIADTQMIIGDFGGELPLDTRAPRRMALDGPFLMALRQESATTPYFLAWLGNTDLMELAK